MRALKRTVLRSARNVEIPVDPADEIHIYWTTDHHIYPESVGGPGEDPDGPNAELGSRIYWDAPRKLRAFVAAANAALAASDPIDLVAHTGDMLEFGTDWSLWHTDWGALDASLPQILVPGNHDFAGSDYATIRTALGRDAAPELGGSAFNRSFGVTKGSAAYRMIVLDTNYLADGSHGPITAQRFHADGLTWLEAELAACPETDVLIWTHGSIHEYTGGHFYEPSATAFRTIVDAAVASRGLRVTCLFGHYHRTSLRAWATLGANIPGYSCPAAVEDGAERYCIVRASEAQVVVDEVAW